MTEAFKMVAPDGGWGWMVVLGMSISNLIIIPILQTFGLVFRELFVSKTLSFSLREVSIIIVTNSACGYILGIFNGPILRTLGFRRVAIAGGFMMFVGLLVTSLAYEFYVFFVFYGLINSLGIGWSMASNHLALSTYFVKKRGMAMGITMSITGLGPVFMPLVIGHLASVYGARGTVLLLSGLVLHCVACGMLLQPIKWHRKKIMINEANGADKTDEEKAMLSGTQNVDARGSKGLSSDDKNGDERDIEMQEFSSLKQQKDELHEIKVDSRSSKKDTEMKNETRAQRIVRLFDFDLLKDPAFLSMCVGMSIALASDMNFSILLPFILGDMNFDTITTAKLQAVVGAADILSRLFVPFIVRKTSLSARVAYLLSLIGVILSRFCLTLTTQFVSVLIVVAMFGVSKGVRAVFMPLVIPNYVPLDKLASAQGLQNVMHGFILMFLGPLIGYVRDKTGNYTLCIHIMNSLTALTILLWTAEFVFMKKKNTFVDVADAER